MKDRVAKDGVTLLAGDVREVLRGLEAESVQCCITSPPYWGLRAYGTAPQVWGGIVACKHEWGAGLPGRTRDRQHVSVAPGARGGGLKASAKNHSTPGGDAFCQKCGAWRGELGQEPTPALFVEHLVEVFREVRRVMRPDAVLWINLGDSYATGGPRSHGGWDGNNKNPDGSPRASRQKGNHWGGPTAVSGLKPKDLCEIPSDVVRALRADGWWLRSRIPWLKRNAMPESTCDRPTQAVEYVFLLTKSARYFYDHEASKMGSSGKSGGACFGKVELDGPGSRRHGKAERAKYDASRARRNSDWFFESWQGLYADDQGNPLAFIVNPAAFKAAHFATFPQKLVEPMVKAGTSEKGCCPKCGTPWERVVEKSGGTIGKGWTDHAHDPEEGLGQSGGGLGDRQDESGKTYQAKTLGWRPGCECYGLPIIEDQPQKPAKKKDEPEADYELRLAMYRVAMGVWRQEWSELKPKYDACETVPCTVLDPFSGAGTTAMVAAQLERRAIGIDLKEEYNRMAAARIGKALNPATFMDRETETGATLFAGKESP